MAFPTKTQTLNTFISSTAEERRPDLIDNFFGSAPLFIYLRKKNKVPLRGGTEIRVSHVYAGTTASSYGRGDEFDTQVREYATTLVFDWRFAYAPVNLDEIDVDLNDTPQAVFDLVDSAMEVGELSLVDDYSAQLFGDGTGNNGKDIDGLAIAVSRTGTYGGLARGTDPQGASIRAAFEDTTGSVLSLSGMNELYGSAIIAKQRPDLLVTTQSLWNRIWDRSQPTERNRPEDTRDIGFDIVRFNKANVMVDSHCPAGFIYYLNTEFWELYVHRKWDMRFRGFMQPVQQQREIGQLIFWSQLVCRGPRFNGVQSGVS